MKERHTVNESIFGKVNFNNQSFHRFNSSVKSSILFVNAEPSRCGGEPALPPSFLFVACSTAGLPAASSSSSKSSS
jgi:hypothetical protein